MTTSLRLRRGTTAQHASFTGGNGEVTVDTTKKTVVVHDGSTAGGTPMATEASVTAINSSVSGKLNAANPSYTGTLTGGTGVVNLGSGQFYKDASGNVMVGGTVQLQSAALTVYGSVLARNSGVDGAYQPAFIAQYAGNSNEANAITTSVSGIADGSGFRFDVSNGAGSASRTTALEVTRSNIKFNSGFGSVATAYGCRAWVNFNGTGTVAIRASGNVSSITDNGTGTYTVNFTTAMPDVNYSVVGAAGGGAGAGDSGVLGLSGTPSITTGSCKVVCIYPGVNLFDATHMMVGIFR